jgi:hypothetical protein
MFFINSPEAGFSLRQRLHKPTVIVHYLHLNASRHDLRLFLVANEQFSSLQSFFN